MAQLTEFERELAEVIQTAGATKGAGCTIDEMIASTGSEDDPEKVKRALRTLLKQWYVYKMDSVHPGLPDEYFTTNKYQQEREIWWGGSRFGRTPTELD